MAAAQSGAPRRRCRSPGDRADIPRCYERSVQGLGTETCEIVGVRDSGVYGVASLPTWRAQVPRTLIAASLGVSDAAFPRRPVVFGRSARTRPRQSLRPVVARRRARVP